jgi:predicted metalloprotease
MAMLWRHGRRSANIEDRRGMAGGPTGYGRAGAVGGVGGLGAVAIVVIALFLGIDPTVLLEGGPIGGTPVGYAPSAGRVDSASDERKDFVAVVLADTEETWHGVFRASGRRYEEPRLVLFSGAVQSACGFAQAAVGPFYCPGDRKLYLDLDFFEDLSRRFGAPGDFAQAYVIAHEVGHHVQTLLGISQRVHAARARQSPAEANAMSVRLELQADCFAGVWAHHADRVRGIVESGDLEEALNAASAIGDDRLQRRGRGFVSPDSFTHGTSAQRARWFRRGFSGGDPQACDTFAADQP